MNANYNWWNHLMVLLCPFVLSNTTIAQHGVDPSWSNQIALPTPPAGSDVGGFLYSNMAVLSNGKRVIFLNKKNGTGGVFHTHSYDGINWTTPQRFAADSLVIGFNSPKIISDHHDNLHIIWASQSPKALYYSQMDSALNLVTDSVRLASNPDFNSYHGMYITVDRSDRLHVMWHEGQTGTSDIPEAYYVRSLDDGNTWSPRTLISSNDGISSGFPRGQFNAYAGDSLAIFWRDSAGSNDWDIHMVTSIDGGANWSTPSVINSSPSYQGDPDMVIDPQGRLHLLYHQSVPINPYWGMRIVYAYSDNLGVSWSPSNFTDTLCLDQRSYLPEGSRYDMSTDVLWTFWKEEDQLGLQGGDMMAAFSNDRGDTWSTPEYVTDHADTSIGFKAVALLPGGGVGVNYELPNAAGSGMMRVLYKERSPVTWGGIQTTTGEALHVYPNPANGQVYISNVQKLDRLVIYDLSGRVVRRTDQLPFDVSGLNPSTYLVEILVEGERSYSKLVVN